MRVLVLDNYDSFTYNLVEYIRTVTESDLVVKRNDEITLEEVASFEKIILSPGPGLPSDAGILKAVIKRYASSKDILGVCLGHQAIAEVFGAELEQSKEMHHGVDSLITKNNTASRILREMPYSFQVGRYHSWQVKRNSLPTCLQVTCEDEEGVIMGLRHEQYRLEGVQFHPESVLTPQGLTMFRSWFSSSEE